MLPASGSAIGKLILELRQELGISQKQFAEQLEVAISTVKRWENNRSKPSPLALKHISGMLQRLGKPGLDLLDKYFPQEKITAQPQGNNTPVEEFQEYIEQLYSRVEGLLQGADSKVILPEQHLVAEALEELQTAVEELKVAQEEILSSNEELATARQALEGERQRYQDLFEFAPDGYLVTDEFGIIQEANRAATILLGVSRKFLIGKPLVQFIVFSQRRDFRTKLNQLGETDSVDEWEVRLAPRDRPEFDAALTVATARNLSKRLSGWRWLLRDITVRKQAELGIQTLNAELEQRVKERTQQLEAANELTNELLWREQTARVEAEAARNQVTNILESITDGFFAVDKEWRFTYLNRQAERLLQKTRCELLGRNLWDEFATAVGSRFYQECHQAVAQQVSVEFEEFLQPLSIWLEVHAYPSVEGLSIYIRDISSKQQALQALRESESRFKRLVESNIVGIVVGDLSGNITEANDAFLEMVGYSRQDLTLKKLHWHEITPQEYRSTDEWAMNEIRTTGSCSPYEKELICAGNSRVPILFGCTLLDQSQDTFVGFIVNNSDRQHAEQKIREQAALLDVTTDAIMVLNCANQQVLYWNNGAEHLYGWQAAEAVGKNVNKLLYKEFPQLQEALHTVVKNGSWQGELHQVTKYGKEITIQSRWTLVRDRHLKPKSILTVDTDITEKKQLETQFLRAQRLESLGTLASGIAHDLNNVLAPILIAAQLLQIQISDERIHKQLKIQEINAQRGADLVKQVLSFARGVQGKRSIIPVRQMILEMEQIVKQTFPKSIKFYKYIPQDLCPVYGDATQLHQVLMNLCVNARDAMPRGGSLGICAENLFIDAEYAKMHLQARIGAYVVVTILDTGIGIPPEIQERIFEPFFTTKEVGEGSGLGLSTVLGILKSHGGFVNLASKVGTGSQFKIYLPAVSPTQTQETEDLEMPLGQGELILVVDDEEGVREITKTSLEAFNYRVITAKNGIEALKLYTQHQHQISVVLMDMMMPSLDGARAIPALEKINPQVKIVAMSGLPSNEKIAQAAGIGVKAFLAKPCTAKQLLQTIKEAIATE